ncbi:PKD domain-containing protein [Meiothermus sp. PNK-Is4]|nr:PKD domain-containing protein [Meiothermus sp. Pnk-1]RYM31531.1 PKD domain-containing protein [Meiothermus sp. PNK-Is4]
MDFVLGELVVSTDDESRLNAFLARWGGRVIGQAEKVGDAPKTYQVQLDPSAAQVERILQQLNQNVPDLKGRFSTSSQAAAQLLAVALAEANQEKMTVTPNFVFTSEAIASGSTSEAPTSSTPGIPYSPNAFEWSYMNRGSAQDIGVGEAWRLLERAGRFSNKVRIMVLDGGFAPNADFPEARVVGSWNVPNPLPCSGGASCPWHGTHVTTSAMGRPDNAFGVAGPAGPVGELLAVPFQGDFIGMITTLERIITATLFGNPKIINMSGGFELDLGWDIAVKVSCLGLCPAPSEVASGFTTAVAASGKLLFAAAGNEGKDVDNGGADIEGSTHIPCELNSVICVGGMAHDATTRDPRSNFGSKPDDDSVDIYGPFWLWTGPDPDNPANQARLRAGSSFSSPFVAGVAALVWAANPSLSASQVWAILRDTAHVGRVGVRNRDRWVNAFAAVARALEVGTSNPSITLSGGPATADLNRRWSVTASVTDFTGNPCPPAYCPLTFEPAPEQVVGNTAFYRFNTTGSRTIRVTARDLLGREGSATRTVNVINSAPVVSISQPTAGATYYVGQAVQLLGSATDLNEGPDPGPGPLPCRWTSSNPGDTAFPRNGCNTTVSFSSTGPRTLTLTATDPQGLSTTASVSITINPAPPNLPPTITLGSLSPGVNYDDGYDWDTRLRASGSATDPEGNTPITYTWRATSYAPGGGTSTVFASNVVISGPTTVSGDLDWTPSSTPSLFAECSAPNAYDGQIVRLTLTATDSLGNSSTRSLPDIKVYRCILI